VKARLATNMEPPSLWRKLGSPRAQKTSRLHRKMGGLQRVSFSGIYRNTPFMSFTNTLFRTAVVAAALGTLALASEPVTVTMQDGSQIKGAFAGGSADEIKVVVAGQTLTLKTANIDAVKFDSGPTPGPARPSKPIYPVPAVPVASHGATTIPANAPVIVRLIDPADSSHDSVGKEYRASLDEPLLNETGVVVAPRGSDVLIVLANRQESGHFAGKTELRLALRSLTIQGKRYDASSTDVVEASSSRTARSGKTIGGLAAAGAVIGAIAGGGKGAAIGAGSGATLVRSERYLHPVSECGCRPRRGSPSDLSSRCSRIEGFAWHDRPLRMKHHAVARCVTGLANVRAIFSIQTDKFFRCGMRPANPRVVLAFFGSVRMAWRVVCAYDRKKALSDVLGRKI